mgnify:CR=1 FL=1
MTNPNNVRLIDETFEEREERWAKEVLYHRKKLREEVIRGLSCKTKAQKMALYRQWQERYCEDQVKTLVNILKNREIAMKIESWWLNDFEKSPNRLDIYSVRRNKK